MSDVNQVSMLRPFSCVLSQFNTASVKAVVMRYLDDNWEVIVTVANADGDFVRWKLVGDFDNPSWKRLP